jgi:hypothetical protein
MNRIRLASLALLCAVPAAFADGATVQSQAPATPQAGMTIFVDPNTGEIREPTLADWLQLPRAAAGKAKITERVLPDGTLMIPAESMMQDMTATIAADGSVQIRCHPDSE